MYWINCNKRLPLEREVVEVRFRINGDTDFMYYTDDIEGYTRKISWWRDNGFYSWQAPIQWRYKRV